MPDELITKYKNKGFKITPQRIAILEFLEGNTAHPTAEEIFKAVKKKYPAISFATIYNTLKYLRQRSDIAEITINPEKKHYDPNTAIHHHIICEVCGRVEDVFKDYSKTLTIPNYLYKKFEIKKVHVDFYGLCKKCQRKGGEKN